MTNPLRTQDMPVVADLLDAIDPALTEDQRLDAARRAVQRRPVFAISMLASLAHGMVSALSDPAGIMSEFRSRLAADTEVR